MTNLSTLIVRGGAGWSDLVVTAINDSGWIVGYGTVNKGSQGFLAVPAGSSLPTSLSVVSAKGQIGSYVTLSATLKNTTLGLPLAGEPVQFSIDGANVGSPAITNPSGQAKLKYAVPEGTALGAHMLAASFGGDAYYATATGSGTLTLSQGPVKIIVRNVTGSAGSTVTLSAKLTDAVNVPLGSETLSFSVAGVAVGSATTNATGTATLSYTIPVGTAAGTYTFLVSFGGDADHLTGSKTGTLTVQ